MFKFKVEKNNDGQYEVWLEEKKIAVFDSSDDNGDNIGAIKADAFTIGYTAGYCNAKDIKFP